MRLLWEESGFELVGAFCVAAFALGASWTVFESMFGLNAVVAGLFAAAVAGWVLEMISRRHYADRLAPAPRRLASSVEPPAPQREAAAAGSPASPSPRAGRSARTAARTTTPAAPATAEHGGAATVAGRRAGRERRAA